MRSVMALLLLLGLCECAPWHDLFQRDRPSEDLIQAALSAAGPEETDVGIALGCPATRGGALSLCQLCRVKAAVASYRQGRVRAIIFSGGAAHNRFVEGAMMAHAAIARGIPPDRVFVEGSALTTWQNLRYSKRIMQARGFRTALVITTADHLPRARRFTEYYGIPARYLACDR